MAQSELVPYTEASRDLAERQLALEANKKALMERHSNGMTVILYYLMKEAICLIYCEDDRTHSAAEFPVPNDEAIQWFNHAFAHPNANLRQYLQSENADG